MLNERMKSVNRAVMKKKEGQSEKEFVNFRKKENSDKDTKSKKCEDFARDNEYVLELILDQIRKN